MENGYIYPTRDIDEEIDLVQMFFYILKKWKSIIAACLIGAVIGVGISYFKNVVSYSSYDPYAPGNEQELLAIQQLNRKYNVYLTQSKKDENGYIAGLDPNGDYVKGTLIYHIKSENSERTQLLGNLFDITMDSKYLADLSEITGFAGDENSLEDIIGYNFQLDKKNTNAQNSGTGIVTFTVNYVTREQRDEILDYIEDYLDEIYAKYLTQVSAAEISKVSRDVKRYGYDVTSQLKYKLYENQSKLYTEYKELYNSIKSSYENSDNILRYYAENFTTDGEKVSYTGSYIKWAVIGAFVGAVLAAGVALVMFICDGAIRSADELTRVYGLNIVGTIAQPLQSRNFIDKMIDKWRGKGDTSNCCDREYVAKSMDMLSRRDICVATFPQDDRGRRLAENLTSLCSQKVVSGNLATDTALLDNSIKAGGVYLIATLGKTKKKDLESALKACKLHNIKVVGTVVLG